MSSKHCAATKSSDFTAAQCANKYLYFTGSFSLHMLFITHKWLFLGVPDFTFFFFF